MKLTEAKLKQMIRESLEDRLRIARSTPQDMLGHNYRIKDRIRSGRFIKQQFNRYADRDFLQSLTLLHYTSPQKLENFFKEVTSKDELSCVAFKQDENPTFGNPLILSNSSVALMVQGRVTILANDMDILVSGGGREYTKENPKRTRDSGANKGTGFVGDEFDHKYGRSYVLDETDWDPLNDYKGRRKNEALVDNWKVLGYCVDSPDKEEHIQSLIEKNLIPEHQIFYLKSAEQ